QRGRPGAARPGRQRRTQASRPERRADMNVSAWSIRNPIPALMLFVLLTFAGLLAFQGMKIQHFPDTDLPIVTVSASLPGASPGQLEADVARKMQDAIATISRLKHVSSVITDGLVSIVA